MSIPQEDFVHLHVHSEFSLLDGLSKIKDLIARAKAMGQPAVALTDHGNMHGAIDFFNAAAEAEIRPIVGVEAYLTQWGRPMNGREAQLDRPRHHLLLLAENQTGYHNLLEIVSAAELQGYYYRPRIDAEFLAAHSEGLICTSGCMAGEVPHYLNDENGTANPKLARDRLQWYLDVFGRDRFYIELQEHSIPALHGINQTLIEWAQKYDVGMIATNDVHYVKAEDATPHDILLCVQTSSNRNQTDRMRMSDGGYYLKSRSEMESLFLPYADLPASVFSNTVKIAEMCNVDLRPTGYHLPDFTVPDGYSAESYLRHLADLGLERRFGDRVQSDEIQTRKEHELKIIHEMGFDAYYLIVWDLCEYAVSRNIWWNVRGSGAGSLIAYAMGITNLDPLPNNLIFERFLNPGRVSMPDFDLDYPDDQRDQMIQYTINKYGEEQVAQIVVFGTMKARGSIRDVGRVMELSLDEVDSVAKLIPGGPKSTIEKGLADVNELSTLYSRDDRIRDLIDTAQKLEGVARHVSIHPAAVIVADKPLVHYTPLRRSPSKGIREYITQYTYPVLESLGLLKLDFLGLSTLTIMRVAAELIERRHGIEFTLENIPTDDPLSYELLASGEVTGIFQVESEGMRNVLRGMRPTKFEHIVATISLYRPGPMQYIETYVNRMHGKEPVQYKHDSLASILAETYGIIVYQEQIIQIAAQLAGYSPGDADLMRRAVAKKKAKEMEHHRIQFIGGAVDRGIPQQNAEAIYEDIVFFANYGFNKSHAADYAVITVQTAYLKAHYPVEYMTALLTVELNNQEKVTAFINESRKMGIDVLPPDVNQSELGFVIREGIVTSDKRTFGRSKFDFQVPDGAAIRFGLGAVKNVGQGPVEEIMRARPEGAFQSLEDFCKRVDLRLVNRRALECLIKVGCFDAYADREEVLAVIDRMMQLSTATWQARDVGQISLFEMLDMADQQQNVESLFEPPPSYNPVPARERLGWEKELLGVYVSEHPLERVSDAHKDIITCDLNDIVGRVGKKVVLAGMVATTRPFFTKKGDRMAFVTLEDLGGMCEVVVFPRLFEATDQALLEEGSIVLIYGKVESRNDRINVIADSITNEFTHRTPVETLPAFATTPPPNPWEVEEPEQEYLAEPEEVEEEPYRSPAPHVEGNQPADASAFTPDNSEGNNGHTSAPLQEEEPPRLLSVQFPLSTDRHENKRKLTATVELLTAYQGRDKFKLIFNDHEGAIELDFPNFTTNYCPDLAQRLQNMLGSDCLRLI